MTQNKKKRHSALLVFLICLLAVPTIGHVMGVMDVANDPEARKAALAVGALLGGMHVLLRPLLRLITAPLGCLTFGLFGMVIDVGMLYACGELVPGFAMPGFLYALLTALVINTVCAVTGSR